MTDQADNENKWKEGDRVQIKPCESWLQPRRGWAERGRKATVLRTFKNMGAKRERVVVRFDRTRAKGVAGEEMFYPEDLISAQE